MRELVEMAMKEAGVTSGRGLDEAIVRRLGDEARVSYTIINAILKGKYHSVPTPATVRTLATMARVSERAAFEAAGLVLHERFELPDSANELTGDQREAVLAVIRAFARANRASGRASSRPDLQAVPEAAMEEPRPGRPRRSRPGESEEPHTER